MSEELTTENKETVTKTEENGKYYTDEEIQLLMQRAGDKRIAQYQKTLEKKQKESERLRNMSEDDRHLYELDKRERELEEKERQLALSENKNECAKILSEKGLSLDFVEFVVAEDAETMNKRIKSIEKAFKNSVKAEVEKRLGSDSPKKNLQTDGAISKEQFRKMSIAEKQNLYNTDRELYNSLSSIT